jgi:hypothetical protein
MTFTRRALLKSAMFAAAVADLAAAERAAAGAAHAPSALRVFDSGSPLSRAWAGSIAAGAIDVAREHSNRWMTLRSLVAPRRVMGCTTWSDYVQARGLLQEHGLRLRFELRSGGLSYWEMLRADV